MPEGRGATLDGHWPKVIECRASSLHRCECIQSWVKRLPKLPPQARAARAARVLTMPAPDRKLAAAEPRPQPTTQSVPPLRRARKAPAAAAPKRPPTPELINGRPAEQLAEMARRHIGYEIKMLRELAAALRGEGAGPRTMRNALLESFLIHYRNLYDFFYPELRRHRIPGDSVATDYLPDPKRWKARREDFDKPAAENRARVNAQLAHLTYRRLRYNTRKWPDRAMARRMEALIDEFLRELPPSRRRWFQRVIATRPEVAA